MQFKGRAVLGFVVLGMIASAIVTYIIMSSPLPVFSQNDAKSITSAPNQSQSSKVDLSKIATTYKLITSKYLEQVDHDKIIDGAINGMLSVLDDPFTVYMDQEEAKEFGEHITSSFQGIGAEVTMENGKVTIVSPIKGSPAEKAGIHSNDVIVSINGEKLDGFTLNQAVMKIRGPKGTQAKLEIIREGLKEPIQLTIIRDDIDIETVYAEMLDNNIGKLEVTQFSTNTGDRFLEELKKLESQGMKGLIIDVRNDPGGLLDVVIKMASEFVPSGEPIVIVEDRDGNQEPTLSKGSSKSYPVVVLINKGSASASEILAGALKESGGATLIGEPTYGKGTVQLTFAKELGDGSNIKMTVFKWLTPHGNWIHKKGIEPDIAVEQPEFFKVAPLSKKTVLKTGLIGDDVKNLQIMLKAVGFDPGQEDGVFTQKTTEAVKQFQRSVQLKATGEVDEETATKLEKAVLAQIKEPKNDLQLMAAIEELKKQIGH